MEKTPTFQIQSFGTYHLLERIAVGGMAEIFKAKQTGARGFEKILVIKKILHHLSEDPEFVEMFEDEAKIAAQLTQANIVQIYELGEIDGTLYITMEYVEGKNLRDITRVCSQRDIHLSVEQCVYIISESLKGLDYAHRKTDASGLPLQIIHRDISPQNIIASYEGEIKVLDFGIAKAASRISKTEAGVLKGKFSYMSPEQASGKIVDQRTDIYACGVIAHELLTSDRLFRAKTDLETLDRVKEGVVAPPSEKNPLVPKELDNIVLKSLAKDPRQRYSTAAEMLNDLSKLQLVRESRFSSQDFSAFMKTLFSSSISEERERLMAALARVPAVVSPHEQILNARTHIAFRTTPAESPTPSSAKKQSPIPNNLTHTVSRKRIEKRRLPLKPLLTLALALGLITFGKLLFQRSSSEPEQTTPAPTSAETAPSPEVSSTGIPIIVPVITPENSPGKVDQVFGEMTPSPEIGLEESPSPTATPTPRAKPSPRPRPTAVPAPIKRMGWIDMLPPPEGFAQLFVDGNDFGTVPGARARGIPLEEGAHQIECRTSKKTYRGKIKVLPEETTRVHCQNL